MQQLQNQDVSVISQAASNMLSPVREVRTPSPTAVRKEEPWASAASVMHNSIKPSAPLQGSANNRLVHGRSVSLSGPSPLGDGVNGNNGVAKVPPINRQAEINALKMNGQAQQLMNGFGSGAVNPNAQASGWQQTTKKGKKGKGKSGSGVQNGDAVNGGERKGG